jgi:siderophore synthetase component
MGADNHAVSAADIEHPKHTIAAITHNIDLCLRLLTTLKNKTSVVSVFPTLTVTVALGSYPTTIRNTSNMGTHIKEIAKYAGEFAPSVPLAIELATVLPISTLITPMAITNSPILE